MEHRRGQGTEAVGAVWTGKAVRRGVEAAAGRAVTGGNAVGELLFGDAGAINF